MLLGTIINTLAVEYTSSENSRVSLLISLKCITDGATNTHQFLFCPKPYYEHIHLPNKNFRCYHLNLIMILLFLNLGSF